MRSEDAVAAIKEAVLGIPADWMGDSRTVARGKELGLTAWQFYFGGRAGVLGEVDAGVVHAVFPFFPAEVVGGGWEGATNVHSPTSLATAYVETCQAWGRAHLATVPGLDTTCELLEKVAVQADHAGLPLFGAWRAQPLPDDAPGRAAQLLQVLREHRGGLHLTAVIAAGLSPLQAVLAFGGEQNAHFLGWDGSCPNVTPTVADLWSGAESVTNVLVARAFAGLTDAERTRLVESVACVAAHRTVGEVAWHPVDRS